jgi:hypothetical protein
MHLPSRVASHNSPTGTIERGNIIVWEQRLGDRLRGVPLEIVAEMEPQSILLRTMTLFVLTIVLAILTFVLAVWLVMRRGKPQVGTREQEAS